MKKALSTGTEARPKEGRSRVTNGATLFVDAATDRRSGRYRRLRDLIEELSIQVGRPTASQRVIVRRVAALSLQCEEAEASLVREESIDAPLYERQTRMILDGLSRLGLLPAASSNQKTGTLPAADPHTAALLGAES